MVTAWPCAHAAPVSPDQGRRSHHTRSNTWSRVTNILSIDIGRTGRSVIRTCGYRRRMKIGAAADILLELGATPALARTPGRSPATAAQSSTTRSCRRRTPARHRGAAVHAIHAPRPSDFPVGRYLFTLAVRRYSRPRRPFRISVRHQETISGCGGLNGRRHHRRHWVGFGRTNGWLRATMTLLPEFVDPLHSGPSH